MNCRMNAYNVSLTFWQREKENLEEKRAGQQGRGRSCGNKDRKRIYQTDTNQDGYRESLHVPQDFHARFLTTDSGTLETEFVVKLCQLSKYSVLATEQVLHCATPLNLQPRIPRFPRHKLLNHSCAGFFSLGLLEGHLSHHF